MRRVRRKGANKEKVFGCDLLEHLNASSQEIPLVLQCCSEFVEKHGVVDGIYRLSGVSSNIQKLRGEFESDGSPDLHKDLYLQDIHCVSSLCKAYFRELPNPLLTYQLYDKFAEAVAIQLEEERLVKIRDVLKELPAPHYRTLEFLMRHLVKMASYSSETNMHSRNLAIVWAPNLLRSKDIEASGFNGTAAFMEVRVQSIVVEFVLTHVPQLFPEPGGSNERRKSLPSPSVVPVQEESLFRSGQPFPHFGNISPGDGPLAIRPYHAIIEGTDKRKGSLKGRKWMSIFNIGGRFQDQRRRHKNSTKEKDRTALRPARSMDSLSSSPYPNEGPRHPAQRIPSTNLSPLVTSSSPQSGPEVTATTGAIGGSEYAVTYRRGTGLVSGGAGTQGTYTSLDPEGLGVTGSETVLSRSPGLSTKVGRRAAMHITGPTIVTVPLHITSNLALGVLQGGGADRVIHRGRDKDGGDRVEGKEVERRENKRVERKVEESRKVEEEERNGGHSGKEMEVEVSTEAGGGGGGEEEGGGKKEEEKEEECGLKPERVVGGGGVSKEQRAKSRSSNTEEETAIDDDEYMDMKGVKPPDCEPEVTQCADESVFDASDILNSTEVEGDDQEMSGYVQDNFEFLDQMDCSVLDHMDCSTYQVTEFSVEPPGHSDDEYEIMEQAHSAELQPDPETPTQRPTELNPHRPLSLDSTNRHTKSLSLPYMTSPINGSDDSCSEEEAAVDDSYDIDYSSEEDECMFVKSLPFDFILSHRPRADSEEEDSCTVPVVTVHQSEDRARHHEFSACIEPTVGDQEDEEERDEEDTDGLEEKELTQEEEEDQQGRDQLENNRQSKATEEDVTEETQSDKERPLTPEASSFGWADFPPPIDDEWVAEADMKVEEEEEEEEEEEADMFDNHHTDYPPYNDCATERDIGDVSLETFGDFSVPVTEERDSKEIEDLCQDMVLEIKEGDEDVTTEEGNGEKAEEKMEGGDKEQESAICRTNSEIWVELEEVICEVIEFEESKQAEKKGARESVAGEEDMIVEEEQGVKVEGEKMVEVEGESNKAEVRVEVEGSAEIPEEKPEMQQEEKETNLPNTREAQRHVREEVVSKDKEKENNDKKKDRTPPSVEKEVRFDVKEDRKCEESDSSLAGVGRKLVSSKNPRVYQVKAVPVVPPKPQHCKITALTLRQQQQQRERRDADAAATAADRGRDGAQRAQTEQDKVCTGEGEDEGRGKRERRRDGEDGRDTSRNSPLSMCFDEAVAIATMRRGKEKECEKEKERQRDWGSEVQ